MHRKLTISLVAFITCLISSNCFSQRSKPDQYRAIQWRIADGLPADIVNISIKDVKGFLWIGSETGGLCRFDGATFRHYIPDEHKQGFIRSAYINAFTEDSLHNIWIGTFKGLSRFDMKADTFTNFPVMSDPSSPEKSIIPFWATKKEVFCFEPGLWITAYDIHSLKRDTLVDLSSDDHVFFGIQSSYSIFDSTSNSVWMLLNNEHGLLQVSLSDGRKQRWVWECNGKCNINRKGSEAMAFDRKRNSIWLNSSEGLVEFSLTNKQFHHTGALKDLLKQEDYDRDVGVDVDNYGRIWFGTKPRGIFIYDPETQLVRELFTDPILQGETGNANFQIYCDREGIVWTSYWLGKGIYELLPYDPPLKRYSANSKIQDSLSNKTIITIIPGPNSKIWLGTNDGLNIFDPVTEKFQVLREKDLPGIQGTTIAPLHIDSIRQKVWLSAKYSTDPYYKFNVYEMDITTRKSNPIIFRDGSKQVDSFMTEPIWIKPFKKGFIVCDELHGIFEINGEDQYATLVIPFNRNVSISKVFLYDERYLFLKNWVQKGTFPLNFTYENKNGKWERIAHHLDSLEWANIYHNKKDQTNWVSFKYELVHYDKDFRILKKYAEADGYTGSIQNMVADDDGNLWFTNIKNQLGRLNAVTGIFTILSAAEGFQKQNYDWFAPAAKDVQGNIFFGAMNFDAEIGGLDRIRPERYLSANPSFVYMSSLSINQKPFPLATGVNNIEKLHLRYNQNTISIETGIIDFYTKGKAHLRYKLETDHKEANWQYGPAYYTLRYEGLPPGSYRLVMQASNAANEFNGPEKIIVIIIDPPFWQTWWFRITAAVALLLLFYGIYRWRTATLRRQKRILEQTVKERTAEVVEEKAVIERQKDVIQSEKEKSDELLLNILPSEVAQELKEKGYTTAKSFDEVTVLFSDIKGFTNVAEKLTAQELVKEINTYFSAFDNIILKYGLEKIKTIGDAYIAAGGLPEKNSATAQNVIEAAIAMQQVVEKLKQERESAGKPYFELRIGIHTGAVVAGVVGIKKFQYDIWGDTVNLAARMEQSGVPGKINISQQTYELVKEQFTCVHRGKIEAKNKGDIDMYFVE